MGCECPDEARRETVTCAPLPGVRMCRRCGYVEPEPVVWGCGRRNCVQDACRESVTMQRARRLWRVMGACGETAWGVVVLTVPGELRGRVNGATMARWRRDVWRLVRDWARDWQWCDVRVSVGGAVVVHPCGEDEERWAPHFNVLYPLVGLYRGRWRYAKVMVDRAALDDLRRRWKGYLRTWGWRGTCQPQVKYEYRGSRRRRRHAARYFARGFPMWQGWTHRVVYYGVLACGKVGALPEVEGVDEVKEYVCPKCGGEMVTVVYATGPPSEQEIDHVLCISAWEVCVRARKNATCGVA